MNKCDGVSDISCPYLNKRNIELIKNLDDRLRCRSCTMKQSLNQNNGIDILNKCLFNQNNKKIKMAVLRYQHYSLNNR